MKNTTDIVNDLAETLLTKLFPPGHFLSRDERFFISGLISATENFLKTKTYVGLPKTISVQIESVYEGDRRSQIVNTFNENLEKHIRDLVAGLADLQLRVSDFAAMQNLHENYLNAMIKAKTGKTAKACIAEKIVGEAQRLLLQTGLNNKEISCRLGFVESSHFSAYFKKHTGITPQGFRQARLD